MALTMFGIIPPLVTPYNADESPDEGAFKALISFVVDKGVHGLYPLGSNGEGVLLTTEERKRLAKAAVEATAHRVPVLISVGALTTREAVELARHAQEVGADGASVLPPFYYRYDDDQIFEHVRAVAEAVPDFPLYLYHVPGAAGNGFSTGLAGRVAAAFPTVVGIKDSSDSLAQTQEYVRVLGKRLTILTGSNTIIIASFFVGAMGVIQSMANAFPEVSVAMWDAFQAGDMQRAIAIQDMLIAVRAVMLKNGRPQLALKTALQLRGLNVGGARRPFHVPTPAQNAAVEAVCREHGLLTPIG